MSDPGPISPRPGRSWLVRVIFWAPLVVPVLWAIFVLCVQPAERLAVPPDRPWLHYVFYDDYDFTAMVLRGLNANHGRIAGPIGERTVDATDYTIGMHENRPLAARYHLEYPHTALLLFRVAAWIGDLPPVLPAALLDCAYHDIAFHEPADATDVAVAAGFRRAIRFLIVVMTLSLLGLILTLRIGYLPGGNLRGNGLLLLLPAALYFSMFRFDIIPTLLTALSLICLGRRHWLAAGALLGLAALVKVYPVLLAPLILRYLWVPGAADGRGWRAACLWMAGGVGVTACCLLPTLWTSGWEALWSPYQFQLNREPFGWTVYGYYLPSSLETNTRLARGFRLGTLALTVLGMAAWPVRDLAGVLRRGTVVVLMFISLSVVFSPQWILWLAPLVLPLASRSWILTILVIALDVTTFLMWPYGIRLPPGWLAAGTPDPLLPDLNYLRFALFALLAAVLLWGDCWSRRLASRRPRSPLSPVVAAGQGVPELYAKEPA